MGVDAQVPLPPVSEHGDDFIPGPTAGPSRSQRGNSSTTSITTPSCFWPEPICIPSDLDDCPDVPASFRCPITYEIMREPAIALSGHTYEREVRNLSSWLAIFPSALFCDPLLLHSGHVCVNTFPKSHTPAPAACCLPPELHEYVECRAWYRTLQTHPLYVHFGHPLFSSNSVWHVVVLCTSCNIVDMFA
jgi:U-box domain